MKCETQAVVLRQSLCRWPHFWHIAALRISGQTETRRSEKHKTCPRYWQNMHWNLHVKRYCAQLIMAKKVSCGYFDKSTTNYTKRIQILTGHLYLPIWSYDCHYCHIPGNFCQSSGLYDEILNVIWPGKQTGGAVHTVLWCDSKLCLLQPDTIIVVLVIRETTFEF